MTLRAASRSTLIPALLALLLAACQQQDAAVAPAAATDAAPAAAEVIADEPAMDPSAAADAGAPADAAPAGEAPAGTADAAAPAADAAQPPAARFAIEGEHYDPIPGGQPFEPLNGKIEVVEVFSYVCPACAMFQPLVNSWKSKAGPDVRLTYVPAPFGGNWDIYVQAFYAAESMGILERSHDGVFKALHVDRSLKGERGTDSPQDIAKVYAQYGADAGQFASTMSSFAVNAKAGRAKQYIAQQRVNSTPTLIVNGRYRIKGRSWEEMLQNTDRVISQVRAGG